MNGLLLLDKPAGISSAGLVNAVKRLLPRGTKIGHAGTLDPFATGLLILLLGKATKRCEELMNHSKQYEATIRLGARTETDDPESAPELTAGAVPPDIQVVTEALKRFIGNIDQLPPVYSALKINGKRACDRVRAGQTVAMKTRKVRVNDVSLLTYAWPDLKVRIDCGRGTYIRAIARDLGDALGVGGYLTELRRTRSGDFRVENALQLDSLRAGEIEGHLIRV